MVLENQVLVGEAINKIITKFPQKTSKAWSLFWISASREKEQPKERKKTHLCGQIKHWVAFTCTGGQQPLKSNVL